MVPAHGQRLPRQGETLKLRRRDWPDRIDKIDGGGFRYGFSMH